MPDTPYSLLTISVLGLLVYGFTWLLVRLGFISGAGQRKFWNALLLIAVFVAGTLGLILAFTVNYKINFPLTNRLLVWHVDFGIALGLIAIFHFSNHIKYYLNIFKKTDNGHKQEKKVSHEQLSVLPGHIQGYKLNLLPFSLGFIAMATQLILIREFLAVFYGNELTIGIMLANWMLLTGTGAYLNRRNAKQPGLKGIMMGLFLLAIIPVLTLFLLYWLRNRILPVGSLPGIGQIITGTAVLLAPFCLLSGWLFGALSFYLSEIKKENNISYTYAWETIGSIAAGILCSMILIFLFEPFQNMFIVLIINTIILFLISWKEIAEGKKRFYIYLLVAVIFGFTALFTSPDRSAMRFLYPEQVIKVLKDTPYGKLVVTEKAGQLNFFDNNTLLFTTNNVILNEETVHYALLQRNITGNVLLIGGSISGMTQECLKYPLKRLDCAELNPGIIRLGETFNYLPADPRSKMYSGDARVLLNRAVHKKSELISVGRSDRKELDSLIYEAIILTVPDPSTLQINRLYTVEFFKMCKSVLVEQGIITLSLTSTGDYVGNDALKIQSTMYQTLKAVFKNVMVIPGEKNYFLASDGPLTTAVSMLGAKQGIENEYVNEFYLDDASIQERSANIMQRISVAAPLNLDFEPVACYRQLHYWLSYQGNFNFYMLVIPLLILLLVIGLRSSGITVALFSAGLSSFSLEIILILTFQVIYGYVYLATGIFITFFMAGLAPGVMLAKRYTGKLTFKLLILLQILSVAILLFSLGSIFIFKHFQIPILTVYVIFSLLIISIAMITGAQFHIASVLKKGNIQQTAAEIYSADLVGSAIGALLVNAWLVPFFGLVNSLLVVAGVIVFAILLMLVKRQT